MSIQSQPPAFSAAPASRCMFASAAAPSMSSPTWVGFTEMTGSTWASAARVSTTSKCWTTANPLRCRSEAHGERAAFAELALDPDRPAHQVHQPLADGKAETDPAGRVIAALKKLLEDAHEVLLRYAVAGVGDRDSNRVTVAAGGDGDRAGMRVTDRVGQQV